MSAMISTLGLDGLSNQERLALAQELLEGVQPEERPSRLTDEQRAELRRRVADADANPDDDIPWEQVKAEARARRGS